MSDDAAVGLRRFEPRDFERVVARWHETNRSSYPYVAEIQRHSFADDRRFFAEHLLPACEVWVAEASGDVVGMIALELPWIRHLAVFGGFRGLGIGARLVALARERSPAALRAFTFQCNTGARRFYERHGFRAVAFGTSPAPESEPDVEYEWRGQPD